MQRQSTSLWVKAIIALAVGLACFLSTRQPVRADTLLNMPILARPFWQPHDYRWRRQRSIKRECHRRVRG
jgi:hypothetical protein